MWPFVALDSGVVTSTDRGSSIRRARKARRLSIDELAKLTGVSARTIGRVERGEVEKPHSLEVLEAELKAELDQYAAERGSPSASDPPLSQATFMQALAHLAHLHAELSADLAEAIRLGQPVDPTDVREWRTEDAPSAKRVPGEQPPHDRGVHRA